MSLRAWFPLNGDLHNQGLDTVTLTMPNANFTNDGKLGKCLSLPGTPTDNFSIPSMAGKKQMSIAYWVRVNEIISNNWLDGISWYSTDGNSSKYSRQEFYYMNSSTNQTSTGIWYEGGKNDGYKHSVGEWHHYVIMVDYSSGYSWFYIDGVLKGTQTNVNTTHYIKGTNFKFGDSTINLSECDVRIYDHILSAKEIKKLSQGLVAHYSLSTNNTNLFNTESIASNWVADGVTLTNRDDSIYGNVLKITSKSGNKRIYRNVSNIWNSGQTYTVSFMARSEAAITCTMSRSLIDFSDPITLSTVWQRHVCQITSTSTVSGGTLSFQLNVANITVYITQIKLELGSKATPYTPGVGDSHYSSMGYNSTTVYDSSGYNYHGVSISTTTNSDSAKYSSSTVFDGTNSYLEFNNLSFMPTMLPLEWSFSFWIYNQDGGNRSVIFSNYKLGTAGNASFGFEKTTSELLRIAYVSGTFDKIIPNSTMTVNAWTHFVITKTTEHLVTVYRNGVQIDSYTNNNYASNGVVYRMGSDKRTDDTRFEGKLSDFRIYSTVLTAADVLELYQTSASIDNNGNLHAYELKEE